MTISLNLTSPNHVTQQIEVSPLSNKASISIKASAWGTAVATLQWRISEEDDPDSWHNTTPAVTFDTNTPARRKISITGARFIRLTTTTADGDADPAAEASIAVV